MAQIEVAVFMGEKKGDISLSYARQLGDGAEERCSMTLLGASLGLSQT
jgi:hypothetical protein